ncbi:pyridoxamine 5'-phosphate oxidase family protein [uncultured Parolsenella sp.]|uniref:pyridoxamine 5'-phosphate oxidase family protein n=1 Tax=uncultured Parolsenella sp. TaxID=2083008 RepID=UPI0027DCEB0B|nr:pyridoxamine 5'-phosphate oxidase family protein [uncultured Parolsenella sp.]
MKRAISDEDARGLLAEGRRAVLAANGDDGYPFAFPIDYRFDADANKIYFHGAKAGQKVDALRRSDKVCLTVMGNERLEDDEWAPYVQSVVVFGRCRLVDDTAKTEAEVRRLALKYYPSAEEVERELEKYPSAVQLYEIEIEHLTGKQVQEK